MIGHKPLHTPVTLSQVPTFLFLSAGTPEQHLKTMLAKIGLHQPDRKPMCRTDGCSICVSPALAISLSLSLSLSPCLSVVLFVFLSTGHVDV